MAHALHQGNKIVTNMFNLGAISKLQKIPNVGIFASWNCDPTQAFSGQW
jgi:uncharacterized protein YacL